MRHLQWITHNPQWFQSQQWSWTSSELALFFSILFFILSCSIQLKSNWTDALHLSYKVLLLTCLLRSSVNIVDELQSTAPGPLEDDFSGIFHSFVGGCLPVEGGSQYASRQHWSTCDCCYGREGERYNNGRNVPPKVFIYAYKHVFATGASKCNGRLTGYPYLKTVVNGWLHSTYSCRAPLLRDGLQRTSKLVLVEVGFQQEIFI